VIGLAASVPVAGKHLFTACGRMRNRGNGKGGGIAAAGLSAEALDVEPALLENDYILQVAYLDPSCRDEVEKKFVSPVFEVDASYDLPTLDDHRKVPGLEQKPPPVRRYFVRVKKAALDRFIDEKGLRDLERGRAEEELVWRNSYALNHACYASLGEKRAFVLSHSKDLLVLKIVGYAEDVVKYYKMDDFPAHIWIGHQRYPTKGRVWHPGGAHPFIGMHEALVHNGDFANYARVTKSLLQRGISPQFLTDTEVSVLLFDLWHRVYRYPIEYLIEALAPTTEFDFSKLPAEKQAVYAALQSAHSKSAPDGPWFFILARSLPAEGALQLLGITDTSMLRPQVFALQDAALRGGKGRIGLIASEKQAIDACLQSLEAEGSFRYPADKYWNARGGSHSDGGSFAFTVKKKEGLLETTDKFGRPVELKGPDYVTVRAREFESAFERKATEAAVRIDYSSRGKLASGDGLLAVDASGFPPEGPESLSIFLTRAYHLGWRRISVYRCRGQRFIGCGFGAGASARIDVYGSPGDYLGSGNDGLEIHVHASAQDQVAQIMKGGRLVIHGDVGQTFLYAAKGGEVFVLGSAAGRPLINAVGKPRVVINGTCLDYLAESFMAGDPLHGGGFVIVNGIRPSGPGAFVELESPYPGANLFSLASGGAIYLRDPRHVVEAEQLNGGHFAPFAPEDWDLIRPYLEQNEKLFGVSVAGLLTHDGRPCPPERIYRKVAPSKIRALIAHD
jgi:glutamate synthase domain-containing protein 1